MCQRQDPSGAAGTGSYLQTGQFELSATYLHWYSDKHYVGTEPNFRINPIGPFNTMNQINLDLTYGLAPRWEVSLDVPVLFHSYDLIRPVAGYSRAPLPVHAGVNGLGDLVARVGYWAFAPVATARGNLQLSLGVQIPTGNDAATFAAYGRVIPAEWSVQPGNGSWGLIPTVKAWRTLGAGFTAFGVATYLITPRDTTGVPTFFQVLSRGTSAQVNSSADQFFGEVGVSGRSPLSWLTPTAGYIVSGVPRVDLIGGSDGFRRPATLAYFAPGIRLSAGGQSFTFSWPMMTYENIKPPVNPVGGRDLTDATVPGFMFSIGYDIRFGGRP